MQPEPPGADDKCYQLAYIMQRLCCRTGNLCSPKDLPEGLDTFTKMYASDGNHPSMAGTYLQGLIIASSMPGETLKRTSHRLHAGAASPQLDARHASEICASSHELGVAVCESSRQADRRGTKP